jgi:predicted CopG family antitoxin
MISKTFVFSRIEKTVDKIENTINDHLKSYDFKFATQNESVVKGKFIVTILGKKKNNSTIRVKAFKSQHHKDIDENVNAFLEDKSMKFITQTFVGSNIYTLIFFDSKKDDSSNPSNTDSDVVTNPPTGEKTNGSN